MKAIVKAILEYQEEKNKLVLKETGIELIPDHLKLTENDLSDEAVMQISRYFQPSTSLNSANCIHCTLYILPSERFSCRGCPYEKANQWCTNAHSIYNKVREKFPKNNLKLLELGKELIERLKNE